MSRDFYSIDDLDQWLDDVLKLKRSEERPTPDKVLEKLGKLVIGFDPGLRRSVVRLLSPIYPQIADWLDSLKEKQR
ncbi:MAG: hypothetical protein GWO41_06165, partial [candidate division Zixibacteria bacterium]|nr:hypothetical protein [candidate division Zixibacteria bacterium]NIR65647.1 hypothetical protein [candidate division Zixibacteria bacterium]NIS15878.1 hypothetical protein [candidate division Zixibacteria bacterium]NIS47337.1 hypothetical protein [candidate division Zixibacteria bacterium]NIT52324.1 hypothetical protein [candidate division Zixibacteria bacterium]